MARPPLLITAEIRKQLLANGQRHMDGIEHDPMPVLKVFNPNGAATWLFTELDPSDNDTLFGLCDMGMGEPELGNVSLKELSEVRTRWGLRMERDMYFTPDKTLSQYAEQARVNRRIIA